MKSNLSQEGEILIVLVLATLYFSWLGWSTILVASDNERLLSTLSHDETEHLKLLKEALKKRSLEIDFISYGHLYFNVALLPLLLAGFFKTISDQQIIVVLRLVSLLFGVLTVSITFLLARRFFGRLTAWLSTLLLMFLPNFIENSVKSHPDTPQLFFIVSGVYLCCRLALEKRLKWLVLASGAAGLAFSTKYSGVFLLPLILMILVVQGITGGGKRIELKSQQYAGYIRYMTVLTGVVCFIAGIVFTPELAGRHLASDGVIDDVYDVELYFIGRVTVLSAGIILILISIPGFMWSRLRRSPDFIDVIKNSALSFMVFGVMLFATSPYLLMNLGFIKGMHAEHRHVVAGHFFTSPDSGLVWLKILMSPPLLDGLIVCLATVAVLSTIHGLFKKGGTSLLKPESIVVAWIFLFTFPLLGFNYRPPRYLLPVTPFIIILAMKTLSQMISAVKNNRSLKSASALAVVVLLIFLLIELPKPIKSVLIVRSIRVNFERKSPSIKAGRWLAENYPHSTRIMYDKFSYIPPSFTDVTDTWGGDVRTLHSFNPDIVVTHNETARRYSDVHNATRYTKGESNFRDKYEYYNGLMEGRLNYTLVHDFGEVKVYERQRR